MHFSPEQWTVLALIGGSCVLGMLHILASRIASDVRIHDHRVECRRVRMAYLKATREIAARGGDTHGDVEILD